ncbi:MAG: hypothetical protein AAFV59_13245 [Pseudomonadota bacterium]
MTTKKQAAANKRNAKKSTGPKTVAGKAKSARNAITMGVLTRPVTAPDEDQEEFIRLQTDLLREFKPETYAAQLLVKRLALLFWREHRLADAETREFRLSELDAMRAEAAGEDAVDEEVARAALKNPNAKPNGEALEKARREARLKVLRTAQLVIPLERQLLIGRYQTMLSNQIRQTYSQLEAEMNRHTNMIEASPIAVPANDIASSGSEQSSEPPAKK